MKRAMSLLMIAFVIASFPVLDIVYADKPNPLGSERTYICHFPGQKDIGRIINVSGLSLTQHTQMHGDVEWPFYTALGGHRSGKAKSCEVAEFIGVCKHRSDGSWTLALIPPQNVNLQMNNGNCLATEPNQPSIGLDDLPGSCSCD